MEMLERMDDQLSGLSSPMPLISTRVHGTMDYPMCVMLMAAPNLLGFDDDEAVSWVPRAVGAMTAATSAMTDYEMGAVRVIPMRMHLSSDLAAGALLAASPWIFGFHRRTW